MTKGTSRKRPSTFPAAATGHESFSEHWRRIQDVGWRIWLRQAWLRYVVPGIEKEDPRFHRTLTRLSIIGLRVVASFCMGGAGIWIVLAFVLVPEALSTHGLVALLSVAAVGLGTMSLSFWSPARRWARPLGLSVLAVLPVLDLVGSFGVPITENERWAFLVVTIMLMQTVAIGALPLRPLQMVAFAALLVALFVGAVSSSGSSVLDGSVPSIALAFLIITSLTSTGLTMIVYYQRVTAYRARRSAEHAFEELREAQVRVSVSENAASQSRFAAALSHELNTPLGALVSAFDTLLHARERERYHPETAPKLDAVWKDASHSGRVSAARLRETIDRMKRLTNLDRAEVQLADVNALWRDTAALLAGTFERHATIELALGPVPRLRCRPHQIGAVFSNLLRNAAAAVGVAVDPSGKDRGHIRVTSERRGEDIVIEVTDDGRGMSPEQVGVLFEPSFHVEGERVATTNWGLFVCRSIVTEHGGTLEIESEEGVGTKARIVLPATPGAAEADPSRIGVA